MVESEHSGYNGSGFKIGSSKTGIRHTVTNCVVWGNRNQGFYANHSSGGNNWYNNTSYNNGTQYDMLARTWDLNITPRDSDFLSVSDEGFMGPRRADGSLPDLNFMKLSNNSQMIDRGTTVGLPYNETAPDLGAYEF